jgi:hypothetical protein
MSGEFQPIISTASSAAAPPDASHVTLIWDATNNCWTQKTFAGVVSFYQACGTPNAQTGSYTLVLADLIAGVTVNDASANTVTIPLNSAVAFPVGCRIPISQLGAGLTTVSGVSGVTVTTGPRYAARGQGSNLTAWQVAANTWNVD